MSIHGLDDVKKAMQQTKKNVNTKLFKIYFKGLASIVKQTPVLHGRARNNWFLSSGAAFSLTSGRDANKSGSGSTNSLNTLPKNVLDKKVYFTNNLPYIGMLEYGGYHSPVKKGTYVNKAIGYEIRSVNGWSRQIDPGGWVRKELISMQNKIRAL